MRTSASIELPGSALALRCADGASDELSTARWRGQLAAAVWAAQQPLDKRVFGSRYDDVELLGKLVTRGPAWPAAGLGASRGQRRDVRRRLRAGAAARARARRIGGRRRPRHWPSTSASGRSASWSTATTRPARSSSRCGATAARSPRPPGATSCSGSCSAELERRLNAEGEFEPLEGVPVSSNGHGNIEHAAVGATEAADRANARARRRTRTDNLFLQVKCSVRVELGGRSAQDKPAPRTARAPSMRGPRSFNALRFG